MKILLDMNLSPRWVQAFAQADVEAAHWSSLGDPAASDPVIIQFAKDHGYVILTQDLDFGSLLSLTNWTKPSVLQLRTEELDPDVIGAQVVRMLGQFARELQEGALLTFDPRKTRVRVLPLRTPELS